MELMLNQLVRKLHHYFLPHESNNFRAKTLHNSSVVLFILLLLFFQTFTNFVKYLKPDILGYATDISVEKLLELVNAKRVEAGLSPLALSDQLSSAATQKAQDMFSKNYWAHVSPTGTTPWVFINSVGYEYTYAGENLARNFNSSAEVVEAWMNSPAHRANILKAEYTDIGLSVMNGSLSGEETTLVVQEFGSRGKSLAQNKPIEKNAVSSIEPEQNQPAQAKNIENNLAGSFIKSPLFVYTFLNKSFSLLVAEFLLIILFIDSLYIWKFKTTRFSSHSLAHIIFFASLIGAMGATGIGAIL